MDGLTIISPLRVGLKHRVKVAIEAREDFRNALAVILDTPGGVVEVVERIVRVLRQHYDEVKFIIPDRAMSAGTVLAMSGDDILMDYHPCLGPIDPQLERDGRLVPALSYLSQFETLVKKSQSETLSLSRRDDIAAKARSVGTPSVRARTRSFHLPAEELADPLQVQGLGEDRDSRGYGST